MRLQAAALLLGASLLAAGCFGGGDAAVASHAEPPEQGVTAPTAACPEPGPAGAGSGARLPDVSLSCLGQPGSLNLRDLPARPVVLNLWASWCGPCREEMPALQRVHRAARGQVLFLGINTSDGQGAARSFVQDFGVTYPSLSDPQATALNRLGGRGLPLTLVLAADGTVLDRTIGGIKQDKLAGVLERAGISLDQAALAGSG